MRLLMVTADFPPAVGGMQAYSWELARTWASRASSLTVIAPRQPGGAELGRDAPCEVRRVFYPGDSFMFSAAGPLCAAVRELRPDAIFATSWSCAFGAQLGQLRSARRAPVFAAAHGRELVLRPFSALRPVQRGYDALRQRALREARAVFPVSRYAAGLVRDRGVPEERIVVVPNGVDPAKYFPRDASALKQRLGLSGRRVLLTLGRIVRRKGIQTVLEALPALTRELPDLAYVVVGDGPDRARLEELAASLGVSERVHWMGRVPDDEVLDYFNLCDVFVMPAQSDQLDVEGFGLVFFEASACAKPVVGARSGGVTDAVIDGETGLLVPPADPAALAYALRGLLLRPEEAAAMGARGREYVSRVGTWEGVGRRIYDAMEGRLC